MKNGLFLLNMAVKQLGAEKNITASLAALGQKTLRPIYRLPDQKTSLRNDGVLYFLAFLLAAKRRRQQIGFRLTSSGRGALKLSAAKASSQLSQLHFLFFFLACRSCKKHTNQTMSQLPTWLHRPA